MKGRTSNTQRTNTVSCYARGGAVSDKETVSAPAQRRHGGDCSLDGNAAKLSLARAMRKRADGGGVNRISEDSKREAAQLREKATGHAIDAGLRGLHSGIGAVGTVLPYGRGNKLFRTFTGSVAGGMGAGAAGSLGARRRDLDEADRIERGIADPGREDRKDGGSVGKKNWISGAIKKPGALHKSLGVPMGEKIPAKKLDKAAHSDNPTLARRANLAKTLKGFNKG